MATADECENLDVEVDIGRHSPLKRKQINSIRISFSRLGFAPLRIGGLSERDVFTFQSMDLEQPAAAEEEAIARMDRFGQC